MSALVTALVLIVLQGSPRDAFLASLAGDWRGTGTVLQSRADVRLTWAWTLDGEFMRLSFVNTMERRRFEGHAYYRAVGGGGDRGWGVENSGMFRPIEGMQDGTAHVSNWGAPETEVGETTYRLTPSGALEVVDRVRGKDGQWREFGRTLLERKK